MPDGEGHAEPGKGQVGVTHGSVGPSTDGKGEPSQAQRQCWQASKLGRRWTRRGSSRRRTRELDRANGERGGPPAKPGLATSRTRWPDSQPHPFRWSWWTVARRMTHGERARRLRPGMTGMGQTA